MKLTDRLDAAVDCVVRAGRATPAFLRRALRIGPAEAVRLIQDLEWLGVVGRVGSGWAVLVSADDWAEVLAEGTR